MPARKGRAAFREARGAGLTLHTLALYGRPYFSLLARLRWGRVEVEALVEYAGRGPDEGRLRYPRETQGGAGPGAG